ncbi:MAG TPA: YCF48-related protein [Ignavibacteriaceae bacterium]|nr:T9SS type A sorting domain-containing protein [Ignavibacterium sp.]HRN26815.1 YCF48-related protein [Ignavibacteriaceae bacterium]HRQ55398.1 YCF48-related protein [Ignavibacteriaceae bacterium]
MKIFSSLLFAVLIFHSIYPQEFNSRINDDSIVVKPNYHRNDNTFLHSYNPNDKEKYFPLNSFNTGTGIWTELNPNVPRVDYIGVDFINSDTGWAVGLYGAVIKTTNGGINWQTIESSTGEILLKVHSFNGQVVIAVGHNGTIIRSTDGGDSFTLLTGITTQELWGVKMLNDTLGWICGRNQTLLKTTDAGLTWQPVTTGFNYHYWSFDFLDNNHFMIACSLGKILKTTNGGTSWTLSQAGNTEDLYTIDVIDTLHIAAAGSFGKNVYSSDGGNTWTENQYTSLSINWIQYINKDTGYITIGTVHLHKTTNRGQSWFNPGFGATGEWQFELLDENLGYGVGAGLTVTKTEDGFYTGENLFLNDNWNDVFFITETTGFALSGAFYKTIDGGINWGKISNVPGGYDILFLDSLTGFLGSNSIYKTTNGGEIWYQTIGTGQTSKMFFTNTLLGWAVGGRNIYKSTDGGETWEIKFTHVSSSFNGISFSDSLNGWVSGGRPQKTTNGGITWIEQTNTLLWNSDDVYFSNQDTCWFAKYSTINNSFFKTTDSGLNWIAIPEVIGARKFYFFPDPVHWVIIGFSQYYITNDYGNNWFEFTEDVPTGLISFYAPTNNLGYAVGNNGLILKYDDTTYIPVELISFEGKLGSNEIILSWITVSELNNQGYYIEKSFDKINWQTLTFIYGKGTTTEINYYSFKDNQPINGKNYYRLKQVDFNGTFSYSEIIAVRYENFPLTLELFQNYPNPFNPNTSIKYSISKTEFVNISLYTILGDKVTELINEEKQPGSYTVTLNANNLSSGIYFYKMLTSSGFTAVNKLIIVK